MEEIKNCTVSFNYKFISNMSLILVIAAHIIVFFITGKYWGYTAAAMLGTQAATFLITTLFYMVSRISERSHRLISRVSLSLFIVVNVGLLVTYLFMCGCV